MLTISDFLVTPIYIFLLYIIGVIYSRRYKSNPLYAKYFLTSFVVRLLGGLSFAFIYLYYYQGGDTLNYYSDSLVITELITQRPLDGLQLVFSGSTFSIYNFPEYMSRMYFRSDPPSLLVSKIGALFNLFTFNSYLCDTILFALVGFFGSWKLFVTLSRIYPSIAGQIAFGCLFIPSVIFWGSGMMKDTLCIALLSYIFCLTIEIFIFRERKIFKWVLLVFYSYLLINIKIYIFMCFVLPVVLLVTFRMANNIKSILIRMGVIYPAMIVLSLSTSYYAINFVAEGDAKYDLDQIESTAKITSSYIGRMSLRSDGSYYNIGNLDFTLSNLPFLFSQAFVVTFFRPFPWEVKNILMVLSTLEGLFYIYLVYKLIVFFLNKKAKKTFTPFVIFCFVFSLLFSFIVGVTSSNFGTLARYKIPALPFFVCGIYVMICEAKSKYKGI